MYDATPFIVIVILLCIYLCVRVIYAITICAEEQAFQAPGVAVQCDVAASVIHEN